MATGCLKEIVPSDTLLTREPVEDGLVVDEEIPVKATDPEVIVARDP
jgi:hypothetical protein